MSHMTSENFPRLEFSSTVMVRSVLHPYLSSLLYLHLCLSSLSALPSFQWENIIIYQFVIIQRLGSSP